MANEKEKQELVEKVSTLVRTKYSGDWYRAFQHYAGKNGGSGTTVDAGALKSLLADAEVGNGLTRGAWAKAIMGEMDSNNDAKIDWDEFGKMLKGDELAQKS